MMKSERGSAGRTFLLVVAVLALFAVVVYLLSERNARTYTLVLEDGYLAVKKGARPSRPPTLRWRRPTRR